MKLFRKMFHIDFKHYEKARHSTLPNFWTTLVYRDDASRTLEKHSCAPHRVTNSSRLSAPVFFGAEVFFCRNPFSPFINRELPTGESSFYPEGLGQSAKRKRRRDVIGHALGRRGSRRVVQFGQISLRFCVNLDQHGWCRENIMKKTYTH